jgi:hypothetical protein
VLQCYNPHGYWGLLGSRVLQRCYRVLQGATKVREEPVTSNWILGAGCGMLDLDGASRELGPPGMGGVGKMTKDDFL